MHRLRGTVRLARLARPRLGLGRRQRDLPAGVDSGRAHRVGQRRARHRVRHGDPIARHPPEHVGAGARLRAIALRGREHLQHLPRRWLAPRVRQQIQRVRAHADHQRRLQTGDVVEEPAAARVHEQRRALQLQQLARVEPGALAAPVPGRPRHPRQHAVAHRRRIVDHRAVSVARGRVAHQVQRAAQRPAPGLVPARAAAHVAAAVTLPAPEPVPAAPGRPLPVRSRGELHLPGRRVVREVRAQVGHRDAPPRGLHPRGERQGQIGELLVVPPQLAVGCAQHQARTAHRRTRGGGLHGVHQALGAVRGLAERDRPRQRPIEDAERDAAPRAVAVAPHIAAPGVEGVAVDRRPLLRSQRSHRRDLLGRQDRVAHAELDQHLQGRRRHTGLGQPQPLGRAPEATLEVVQPPDELGAPVARRRERHDRVRVRLRDRAALPQPPPLSGVRLAQARLQRRVVAPQPARQRGPEVEREALVVVDDGLDAPRRAVDAREGVRPIALGVDARVPVVGRRRRRLARHLIGPRVLARRLVEVAVEAERDRRDVRRVQKFLERVNNVSFAFWTTVTPPSLTV